ETIACPVLPAPPTSIPLWNEEHPEQLLGPYLEVIRFVSGTTQAISPLISTEPALSPPATSEQFIVKPPNCPTKPVTPGTQFLFSPCGSLAAPIGAYLEPNSSIDTKPSFSILLPKFSITYLIPSSIVAN